MATCVAVQSAGVIRGSDGAPDPSTSIAVARRIRGAEAAAVPIAFLLANATSYVLVLVAAHRMTTSDYGALSSLLGLLLISTIPMLALQTVAARRAATGDGSAGIIRGTAQLAALATATLCAFSPALSAFLHLHGVAAILLVAATIPASAVLGTAMGSAQGRRRFRRLALVILAATGGRSLGGLAGLLIGDSPDAVLIGVLAGSTLAAVAIVAPSRPARRPYRGGFGTPQRTGVLREALHAGHAHGAFLLLTSLDVLLARHVLTPAAAGTYAVGSVVTRAALWLPQSAVLLLFASLAEPHRHRLAARRTAAAVIFIGLLGVAGSAVFGHLVVRVVGGDKYHELDGTIWLYAALGALLAALQMAVLAGLAQRNPRRAALLWATIVADLAAALMLSADATPTRLAAALVSVAGVSVAVALWLTLRQVAAPAGQGPAAKLGSSPAPKRDATPEGTG